MIQFFRHQKDIIFLMIILSHLPNGLEILSEYYANE